MTDYDKLYIGGKWVAPATDQVLEVFSPATEERVGSCPVASPADIDDAVATARRHSTKVRGRRPLPPSAGRSSRRRRN